MKNIKSPLTISSNPPAKSGMDFDLLRKEGIKHIQALAGDVWTNYNTSDPGITILEHLCYAITDLSYRLSFTMEDLLAEYPGADNQKVVNLVFTARDILTTNPLTVNDYRRLLLDMPGVKNAWLEKLEPLGNDRPILKLNGLHRVLIEPNGSKGDISSAMIEELLHKNRNLGEDFYVTILGPEEITVKATIEVQEDANVQDLILELYTAISQLISPKIIFYSLEELLEKGERVEDIFNGPPLKNGFIDQAELKKFNKKSEIYLSDIIQIIYKNSNVKLIKEISISSDQNQGQEISSGVLPLQSNKAPIFKDIKELINKNAPDIKFYKNGILIELDYAEVQEKLKNFNQQIKISEKKDEDISLTIGRYRHLADYTSIQQDFPNNYNLSSRPTNVERAAQTKQLKAYLLFYDQILANYFSQLDGVKDLFNFNNKALDKTYFNQIIKSDIDFDLLFVNGEQQYAQELDKISEAEEDKFIRQNKLLDHLLARFGESFTGYSLLLSAENDRETVINKKLKQLRTYPKTSSLRNRAPNYKLPDDKSCMLQQRIGDLLGLSDDATKKFSIIEHILLRPFKELNDKTVPEFDNVNNLISVISDPYSCQISFIFPIDIEPFKQLYLNNNTKAIEEIINREIPVHLSAYYHWFDEKKIATFNKLYNEWSSKIVGDPNEAWVLSFRIIKLLFNIGGIGFTAIEEDFVVSDLISGIGTTTIEKDFIVT